jgi:hypothetical protein
MPVLPEREPQRQMQTEGRMAILGRKSWGEQKSTKIACDSNPESFTADMPQATPPFEPEP